MKEIDFCKIGKKIKELRISQNLTQEYVANMADVNTSHISNIENNHTKVSLGVLMAIANALNTSIDYLLADQFENSALALDNEILRALRGRDNQTKEKLLKIAEIL